MARKITLLMGFVHITQLWN